MINLTRFDYTKIKIILYIFKIMSDKKQDKGVLKEIVDFLKSSKNFLQACEKPKDGKFQI